MQKDQGGSFLDTLMGVIDSINGVIWADWVLYTVLGVGVLFTLWTGFCQFRALFHGTAVTAGKYDDKDDPGAINHFQALSAALSATVGLGNIAGVALAIALGGPGAVFWMWMVGLAGMALKTTSVTLSMLYRNVDDPANPRGGPMYVAQKGFEAWGLKGLGTLIGGLFCITLFISAITGGNMFQAWSVGDMTQEATSGSIPSIAAGIILAIVVGMVIIGGIKRIGHVAGVLVPAMCVLYLLAGAAVLIMNIGEIPGIFAMIFKSAFSPQDATGAFIGGTAGYAFLWGMKRALFSSEAGQGSSPIAHAAAKTKEPVREAVVAGLEPFIDTIVVCTLTALVILSTGAWDRGGEGEAVLAQTPKITKVTYGTLDGDPSFTRVEGENTESSEILWHSGVKRATSENGPASWQIPLSGGDEKWKKIKKALIMVEVEQPTESDSNQSATEKKIIQVKGLITKADEAYYLDCAPFTSTMQPKLASNMIYKDPLSWIFGSEGILPGEKEPTWFVPLPSKTDTAKKTTGKDWVGKKDNKDKTFDSAFLVAKVGAISDKTGTDLERIPCTVTEREGNFFLVFSEPVESDSKPALVSSNVFKEYKGAALTAHAFDRSIPGLGKWLVLIAAWLFAISTMISWSYYGEQAVVFVLGTWAVIPYKILYCLMIVVSTMGFIETEAELDSFTALGTGVMLWANIPIMVIFGAIAMKAYHSYGKRLKAGEFTSHAARNIDTMAKE